jgi:hypothetical protein
MQQILSAVAAVVLGAMGWVILEFIGRPIRQFLDLRREIRRQIIFLENIDSMDLDPTQISHESLKEHTQKLNQAATIFRDLGSQVIAFDQTEWFAARAVRLVGLRPIQAGRGLIGLAKCLEDEMEAEAYRTVVDHSLRFDRMGEYDWKHAPE